MLKCQVPDRIGSTELKCHWEFTSKLGYNQLKKCWRWKKTGIFCVIHHEMKRISRHLHTKVKIFSS